MTKKASFSGDLKKHKNNLKNCTALIVISPENKRQAGENLAATLETATASFGKVIVIVAGALQRYLVLLEKELESNKTEVSQPQPKGPAATWFSTNQTHLDKAKISRNNITEWQTWLDNSAFKESLKTVTELLEQDSNFKTQVENSMLGFFTRSKKFKQTNITDEIKAIGRAYVLEECAMWLVWKADIKAEFLLYPGDLNPAMKYLLQKFIYDQNLDLYTHLKVVIKKIEDVVELRHKTELSSVRSHSFPPFPPNIYSHWAKKEKNTNEDDTALKLAVQVIKEHATKNPEQVKKVLEEISQEVEKTSPSTDRNKNASSYPDDKSTNNDSQNSTLKGLRLTASTEF